MRNRIVFVTDGSKKAQFAELVDWLDNTFNIDVSVKDNGQDVAFTWNKQHNGIDYWQIFSKLKELKLLFYIDSVEFR